MHDGRQDEMQDETQNGMPVVLTGEGMNTLLTPLTLDISPLQLGFTLTERDVSLHRTVGFYEIKC